jgi:hypothetical protein
MNQATIRSRNLFSLPAFTRLKHPGVILGFIILVALASFEIFNFSTTEFALKDMLGSLSFAGVSWATILTIAFCGIDFAGIARLFTPEQGRDEPREVWYLFGAWFLAATMNALLTWWGVSMAIANHTVKSASVMDAKTLTTVVPVFVAMMVWVIRILIIGMISVAGDRFIWGDNRLQRHSEIRHSPVLGASTNHISASPAAPTTYTRPVMPRQVPHNTSINRGEPTYHTMVSAQPAVGEISRPEIIQ